MTKRETLRSIASIAAAAFSPPPGGRYLEAPGGVRLHYTVEGDGPPVILIHGLAVDNRLNWRWSGIVNALAPRFTVISMDVRGHGRSSKPYDSKLYGIEMVDDVVRLMDHLGYAKVHVAGYSMGAFITMKLLARHPDRIICAAPCAAGWSKPEGRNLHVLETLPESLDQGRGFGPLLEYVNGMNVKHPFPPLWFVDRLLKAMNDVKALAALIRSFTELVLSEEEVRGIRTPVLSIVGDIDPLKEGIDNMMGVLPNHEVAVIGGADHVTAIRSGEFPVLLESFLLKHRSYV